MTQPIYITVHKLPTFLLAIVIINYPSPISHGPKKVDPKAVGGGEYPASQPASKQANSINHLGKDKMLQSLFSFDLILIYIL